ncbi:MAG TPA: hypothetical protein VL354_20035, partial [Spirochaetia bacterium]|nr:hypothetical protein [Spirochaetia bacterium]
MKRLIPVILAGIFLGGCATLTPPSAGTDSSLIMGTLKLNVSGAGIAPNGADGFLNASVPSAAAVIIQGGTSGNTYEIRADIPSGFFTLANVEPGTYKLMKLWAQMKTSNSYVTITSNFNLGPSFEVAPGKVANLGVSTWNFSYDLGRSVSRNSFAFNSDFPAVATALTQADPSSVWGGRASDQIAFTGETAATPQAVALQPRSSFFNRILFP